MVCGVVFGQVVRPCIHACLLVHSVCLVGYGGHAMQPGKGCGGGFGAQGVVGVHRVVD